MTDFERIQKAEEEIKIFDEKKEEMATVLCYDTAVVYILATTDSIIEYVANPLLVTIARYIRNYLYGDINKIEFASMLGADLALKFMELKQSDTDMMMKEVNNFIDKIALINSICDNTYKEIINDIMETLISIVSHIS